MSNGNKRSGGKQRRLRVRGVRRNPPDLKKLASALVELAQAQAETDALVEHERAAVKAKAKPQPNQRKSA